MAKHIWSILCEKAITDNESNNISLINAIEQIGTSSDLKYNEQGFLPAGINCTLVTLWSRADPNIPESITARVVCKTPSGRVWHEFEYTADLDNHPRGRFKLNFQGLLVEGPGVHLFVVQARSTTKSGNIRWKTAAEVPLTVEITAKEPTPKPTSH